MVLVSHSEFQTHYLNNEYLNECFKFFRDFWTIRFGCIRFTIPSTCNLPNIYLLIKCKRFDTASDTNDLMNWPLL